MAPRAVAPNFKAVAFARDFETVPATNVGEALYTATSGVSRKMSNVEPRPPACPSCARPMNLSRTMKAEYGRYEMQTFQCALCQVWYTRIEREAGEGEAE